MFIRDLVAKIGFRVDTRSLDKFDKSISRTKVNLQGISKQAKIAVAAITAVTGSMFALTVSTSNTIRLTDQLSKQIGITADELRLYDRASQAAGFRTDQFTNALLRFDIMLGQAKISTAGTSKEFLALGINTKNASGEMKDTVTLLTEASRKLLGLKDQANQTAISYRLFGTTNLAMARFMGQSSEAMLEQINTIRDLTFEIDHNAVAASEKFSRSWSETKTVLTAVKEQLALDFMPVFNELLDNFKSWFVVNKDLIRQNISTTVTVLSKTFSALSTIVSIALKPFNLLIDALGGFENALSLTASVLGVLFIPRVLAGVKAIKLFSLALLANPVTLLITAITALGVAITALVVEDIGAWVTGNESAIGKMLGSWEDFKVSMSGVWSDITDDVLKYIRMIGDHWDALGNALEDVGSKVKDFLTPNIFKSADLETNVVNNVITKELKKIEEDTGLKVSLSRGKRYKSTKQKPTNLDSAPRLQDERKLDMAKLVPVERVNGLRVSEGGDRHRFDSAAPIPPVRPVTQSSVSNNVNRASNVSTNNVTQKITENITVNVPQGTTSEQSSSISMQVANEVKKQFETSIIQGLDSISMR